MDAGVVELDALPDADGAGAHDDDLAAGARNGVVLLLVRRVEVRRLRAELGSAGVDHLIGRHDAGPMASSPDIAGSGVGESGDDVIGEAHALGAPQQGVIDLGGLQRPLHVDDVLYLVKEVSVPFGQGRDGIHGHPAPQRLGDGEDPLVRGGRQLGEYPVLGPVQRVEVLLVDLQGANRLQQPLLHRTADGHDLAGALHLSAQHAVHHAELVERPPGHLQHHVVYGRLQRGEGVPRYVVGDLVQRVAHRDLGPHPGDRVPGSLGREGGRARHPRVHFDHAVLPAVGIEGELDVAPSLDAQGADGLDAGVPQPLLVLVAEGLGRSDDDRFPGMDAHGVEVLHAADDDAVVIAIAHDLILELLPSQHALLYQHLMDARVGETAAGDGLQLRLVVGDASARPSQGVRRSDQHGVRPDVPGRPLGLLHRMHGPALRYRLPDAYHHLPEQLPVLRQRDGIRLSAQQLDPQAVQGPVLRQLRAYVERGLAAHPGEDAVDLLLLRYPSHHRCGERLDVHDVGRLHVGLYGGRVGVHEHRSIAFLAQRAARLGAGEVELRRLPDDDRTGAYDHDLLQVGPLHRHPSSMVTNSSKRKVVSCGPDLASG